MERDECRYCQVIFLERCQDTFMVKRNSFQKMVLEKNGYPNGEKDFCLTPQMKFILRLIKTDDIYKQKARATKT